MEGILVKKEYKEFEMEITEFTVPSVLTGLSGGDLGDIDEY